MPYIKKQNREKFFNTIVEFDKVSPGINEGDMNYVISELLLIYLREHKKCYSTINSILGILYAVALEFYRRCASGYEDKKIEENGDIYDI